MEHGIARKFYGALIIHANWDRSSKRAYNFVY